MCRRRGHRQARPIPAAHRGSADALTKTKDLLVTLTSDDHLNRKVPGRRETNLATVRAFMDRLEARDLEGFLALWSSDGVQEMPFAPPGVPTTLKGMEELRPFWTAVFDRMKRMAFIDVEIEGIGDGAGALAQHSGRITLADGRAYNNRYACVFRFDDEGRIRLYREHFNPLVVIEAFGDASALNDAFGVEEHRA
jgi:uncharacterized protein